MISFNFFKSKIILVTFMLFAFTKDAYAYLDPGSGNAIICLLLSLAGAFVYYAKSLFYKFVSIFTEQKVNEEKNKQIAIFSEGKNYWLTYKPIVEELISQKVHFIYYSMDIHDPALTIDNVYMHSKYIGSNNRGYAKVGSLRTKILLTTTPNIGCAGYPLRRPKNVEKLCHVWHSISDTSAYHIGALDHYDVALTVGNWVESSLRLIEKIRKLNKKEIIPVGLPYFDELRKIYDKKLLNYTKSMSTCVIESHPEHKTILVAPSWGAKSCLRVYGTGFIKNALELGYNIIYRPHPQSIKVENDFVKKVCSQFKLYKNFSFDCNSDPSDSMIKSDMMISDKSGVRFDYAFIYEKPVLTLDLPFDVMDEYEAIFLGKVWGEQEAELIGKRLQLSEKDRIIDSIKETMEFKATDIKGIRNKILCNYGSSAVQIVNWIKSECTQ